MNLQSLEKVSLNSLFTFGATIALMLHPVVLSQAITIRMYTMLVALIFVLMLKAIKQKYMQSTVAPPKDSLLHYS